ncbi:hypothetical protein L6452_20147 [Arctium lappa]|uniref:Uncharacterized protein n=1 Tax=Arctium lappa TaxID=4217 RepID=A0ACB9BA30_ARCLA|nr:hypothetical protein L6452_20147 [Arctium lappa]
MNFGALTSSFLQKQLFWLIHQLLLKCVYTLLSTVCNLPEGLLSRKCLCRKGVMQLGLASKPELVSSSMAMETPPVRLRCAHEKLLYGPSAASTDILEPSLVNDHPAVSMSNTEKEKLLTDDINEKVQPGCTEHLASRVDEDYMEKIRELHDRLDMVKEIVRPGCSYEVLKTALSFMSSLATILSHMLPQKLQASL